MQAVVCENPDCRRAFSCYPGTAVCPVCRHNFYVYATATREDPPACPGVLGAGLSSQANSGPLAKSGSSNPKFAMGSTKARLDLVPPAATIWMAEALENGALEVERDDGQVGYGPYSWRESPIDVMTYVGAMLRHTMAYLDGQNFDPKSMRRTIGHVLACAAIIADATEQGTLVDNRPPPGCAPQMLEEHDLRMQANRWGEVPPDQCKSPEGYWHPNLPDEIHATHAEPPGQGPTQEELAKTTADGWRRWGQRVGH